MKTSKTRFNEQIKYEIRFYEELLKQKPHYIDALIALADLYTKVGEIKKGVVLDERLSKLCPDDETVFYNLACSYSLTGQLKRGFEALRRAIRLGYSDFKHLNHDSDLESLRKSKKYGPWIKKWASSHS